MAVQDDDREREMVALFNLTVPGDRGRADIDAYLELESGPLLPFELKSTTKASISTVRDFGPEHIAKWAVLHWIFAFYTPEPRLKYCYYASPADMAGWIGAKEEYVRPDMVLANEASRLVDDEVLTNVIGTSETFTLVQAQNIMKKQWGIAQYKDFADLPGHRFSRERMRALVQERCAYVIRRGATLNNPHIPESYLLNQGLEPITKNNAIRLRELVGEYLASDRGPVLVDPAIVAQARASETDDATA